jgi:two-component system sensor kinase FixL
MSEQIDKRSDAWLATAFSMGPVIMTITQLATGRIVEVNERFLTTTGDTREEVLGRTPLEIELWINPERRAEILKRLREGQPIREIEADFRMKSGEVRTCLMSADLIELNGEACVLTALTDITERKQAEAVLTRYHLLSERARDIMLFILPDGQIVEANTAAVASYGYDRAALLSKNIRDLCDPPTAADFVAQLAQVHASGSLFSTIQQRNDGSTFPAEVSLSGTDIGGQQLLLSIIRDITGRKQAEAALRASQDRLAGIVTSAMDAIITVNAQQRIMLFNRAAEHMFGYTTQELTGQPLDRIIPQRFRLAHQGHIARFGQTGVTDRAMGELGAISGLRADGTEFPIEAAISQVEAAGQKLYTVILRDITSRRQAELERAELLEREYAARAAAEAAVRIRDTFLSTAAHELKTPLTVLLGNIQIMQRRQSRAASLAEPDARLLRIIGDQAARLNRLIALLLDVSRLQTGQLSITRTPLDLGALVQRVVDDVQPTLVQHTLTCSLPDIPLMIDGDELRLEQVLQNLLSNAVKYSPAGGPITVRAERQGERIRVAVADQGVGIPQENLPKLFERFYRADNVDQQQISGMGIGLHVVRAIVELHDGQVDVVSSEASGSIFTVYLPAMPV